MVVPPFCPGVKIEIIVDGHPLAEYDDSAGSSNSPNTVTRYIEVQTGALFCVKITIGEEFLFPVGDIVAKVTLDNRYDAFRFLHTKEFFKPEGKTISSHRTALSPQANVEQRFRFAALQVVEDCGSTLDENLKDTLKGIGEITIRLRYVQSIRRSRRRSIPRVVSDEGLNRVPEKALKGDHKSHYARLDPPVPASFNWSTVDYIGKAPFVTARFKYRSLDALQALQIVPPPVPLEERPEEELNNAELQELVKRFKRDRARRHVKSEHGIDDIEDDDVVAVEAPTRKRRRGKDNEVILLD